MILLGLLIFGVALIDHANARGFLDHAGPVNWAVAAINQTGLADFDKRCSAITTGLNADGSMDMNASNNANTDPTAVTINPAVDFPKAWVQPCRTITASQLSSILEQITYDGQITLEGFHLVADPNAVLQAKQSGSYPLISLANSDYKISLKLGYAKIDGQFYIDNSHLISLDLQNVDFNGPFNAENLIVDDGLQIDNIYFVSSLDLQSLESPSFFWMGRVQSNPNSHGIMAQHMRVGGSFYYFGQIRVHNSDFSNSDFGRWFYFQHTVLTTGLQCRSCAIAGNLEVSGNADLQSSNDKNELNFSESEIKNDVAIECGAKLDNLDLRDAVIGGSFLTVSGEDCGFQINTLDLSEANISKRLDFSRFNAASWDFGQDLIAGGTPRDQLYLVNAKVNSFADCVSAWPTLFQIDGFTYNNIHDAYQESCRISDENEQPGVAVDWIAWLNRNNPTFNNSLRNIFWNSSTGLDQNFDPQPYTYLANYFQSEGLKGEANKIRYQSKFYEMRDDWRQGNTFAALGNTILWLVAGFGIGAMAVKHLFLVILGSILIGVFYIRRSPVVVEDNFIHAVSGI